jgi:hypothetical protein
MSHTGRGGGLCLLYVYDAVDTDCGLVLALRHEVQGAMPGFRVGVNHQVRGVPVLAVKGGGDVVVHFSSFVVVGTTIS